MPVIERSDMVLHTPSPSQTHPPTHPFTHRQWNFVMHPVNAAKSADPDGHYVRKWCVSADTRPLQPVSPVPQRVQFLCVSESRCAWIRNCCVRVHVQHLREPPPPRLCAGARS